jgi:outer membrane receptor protein involved in Fe transport
MNIYGRTTMKKQYRLRKRLLTSLISAAVATIAAGPTMSWAQSADATLRGMAAPNSDVTAKNTATGAVRRTKASDDGSYALVGLPPGTYQVDAGPGTEKTVTLTVASTGTLDLVAGAAPGAAAAPTTLEGISVSAAALTEVKTSEVGGTISLHQIQTIPQITRNFLEFADTVPGMEFTVNKGNTSIQAGAQANSAINVYIDGVGQKNYVKAGGITGQSGPQNGGDPGNPFPQLAIGEYKVITSNYKAEYDQISSAAITAQTKSGTNEFHGEVFDTYTEDSWRAPTPAEQAAGTKAKSTNKEYGLAIGGPIIQDAMHFFFTYEGKQFSTPTSVQPPPITYNGQSAAVFLPADVQSQYGPSTQPFDEHLYFGKIDWEFSDRDRVEVSSKVRQETQIYGASGTVAASANFDYKNDDTRIDGRWQHSADAWFNELLVTWEKTADQPTPLTNNPATDYFWQPTNQELILINGQDPRQYSDKNQKGPGIQDDLTFTSFNWNGDHVIKVGAKYKEITLNARDSSDAAKYYYFVTPDGTQPIPYQVIFGKVNSGLPLTATSKNKQFGTYFQDDWTVNDHLTFNLGLRWDYEETPSFVNYHTLDRIVAAINGPDTQSGAAPGQTYAQTLAKGGININNYISTGSNRSTPKNQWQPRLGFSYDLNGDSDHVVFGGVGRAYDRNLFDVLQLENSKNALSQPELHFVNPFGYQGCTAETLSNTCFVWDPKYLDSANLQGLGSGVGEVNMFNNELKSPYSDQFSIGMRNRLGDWNTSAAFARINSYNGIIGQLGNRYGDGAFYHDGSQWGASGVPGIGSLILFDNGKETRSNQLLLSAEKLYTPDSGWGATLAYTYTDAEQNRLYTDGYAFDLPTIKDYPFLRSSAASKHRFVATGSIDGGWGILWASKLTLATPQPVADIACCNLIPNSLNAPAYPAVGTPKGYKFMFGGPVFGYRDVDLQATKNFDLTRGINLYIRFDVLNVFNFKNYSTTFNTWDDGTGHLNPHAVVYNTNGDIDGVTRTFKLSAGVRW